MSDAAAPPPQSLRARVLIPFAIVTLIWSGTWIVIRDQLGVVPASWSVSYRFLIAGIALLGWSLATRERGSLDARGWLFAASIGVLQFVLNFNLVYRAEAYITSGLVAVMFALLLVPNALLGRVFLGQRLGRQLAAGSVLAMAGVGLLFVQEVRADPNGPSASLTGILLTLGAILSASCANVLQATETARRYPMLRTIAFAMLIGAGLNAVWAWGTAGPPVMDWRWGYVAGVLYLGIAASALAFPLYYGVLRIIGTAKAAYSSVIVPVIAMLLSTIFEGYRWSLLGATGGVLAGIGLIVALSARRPNR